LRRIPDDNSSIETSGGERSNVGTALLKWAHVGDAVLMLGGQNSLLGVAGTLVDSSLEFVEGIWFLSSGGRDGWWVSSLVDLANQFPASRVLELNWSAIVSGSDDVVFTEEEEITEWKIVESDGLDGWCLLRDISDVDGAILSDESDTVSRGRPTSRLDPASWLIHLGKNITKSECSVWSLWSSLVDSLDEGTNNSASEIGRSSHEETVVWMPVNMGNSGLVLLDVLGDPPDVILFEIAN